eukprot:6213184-Pleurochrysis_carterae.AAC.1
MRTTTSAKPCDKCNMPHRGECYGETIATGKLTLKQAAETFTFISDLGSSLTCCSSCGSQALVPEPPGAQGRRQPQTRHARAHVRHD